jgi:hypothetical protein
MYERLSEKARDKLKDFVDLDERYTTFFHWNREILNTPNSSRLSKRNGYFIVEYLNGDSYPHSQGEILNVDTALRNALSIFEDIDVSTIYVSTEHSFFQYNSMLDTISETTNNHHLVAMIDVPRQEDNIV